MINISVDSVDHIQHSSNQEVFNDQESIIELVLEKVMGIENAIDEKQDTDSQNQESNNSLKYKFESLQQMGVSKFLSIINSHQSEHEHYYIVSNLSDGFLKTITPPPQA